MNPLWTKDEVQLLKNAKRKIEGLGPEVKKNEEKFIQLRNTLALNALHAYGYKERKLDEVHIFFTHIFPKIIEKSKAKRLQQNLSSQSLNNNVEEIQNNLECKNKDVENVQTTPKKTEETVPTSDIKNRKRKRPIKEIEKEVSGGDGSMEVDVPPGNCDKESTSVIPQSVVDPVTSASPKKISVIPQSVVDPVASASPKKVSVIPQSVVDPVTSASPKKVSVIPQSVVDPVTSASPKKVSVIPQSVVDPVTSASPKQVSVIPQSVVDPETSASPNKVNVKVLKTYQKKNTKLRGTAESANICNTSLLESNKNKSIVDNTADIRCKNKEKRPQTSCGIEAQNNELNLEAPVICENVPSMENNKRRLRSNSKVFKNNNFKKCHENKNKKIGFNTAIHNIDVDKQLETPGVSKQNELMNESNSTKPDFRNDSYELFTSIENDFNSTVNNNDVDKQLETSCISKQIELTSTKPDFKNDSCELTTSNENNNDLNNTANNNAVDKQLKTACVSKQIELMNKPTSTKPDLKNDSCKLTTSNENKNDLNNTANNNAVDKQLKTACVSKQIELINEPTSTKPDLKNDSCKLTTSNENKNDLNNTANNNAVDKELKTACVSKQIELINEPTSTKPDLKNDSCKLITSNENKNGLNNTANNNAVDKELKTACVSKQIELMNGPTSTKTNLKNDSCKLTTSNENKNDLNNTANNNAVDKELKTACVSKQIELMNGPTSTKTNLKNDSCKLTTSNENKNGLNNTANNNAVDKQLKTACVSKQIELMNGPTSTKTNLKNYSCELTTSNENKKGSNSTVDNNDVDEQLKTMNAPTSTKPELRNASSELTTSYDVTIESVVTEKLVENIRNPLEILKNTVATESIVTEPKKIFINDLLNTEKESIDQDNAEEHSDRIMGGTIYNETLNQKNNSCSGLADTKRHRKSKFCLCNERVCICILNNYKCDTNINAKRSTRSQSFDSVDQNKQPERQSGAFEDQIKLSNEGPKVSDIHIPENVDRSLPEGNLSTLPNTPNTSTNNNKKRVPSEKRKNYLRERSKKYSKIRKQRKIIEKQLKIIQTEMELSERTGNASFEQCTPSVNDTSSFHTQVTYRKYKNLESEHEDEHETNSSNCESPRRNENQFNQINVICSGYNRDRNRNFTSAGFHAYNNKRHYRTYNNDNYHNIEKWNVSFPSEHQTAQPTVFFVTGHEMKLRENDENSAEDKTGLPGKQTPRKARTMNSSITEHNEGKMEENSKNEELQEFVVPGATSSPIPDTSITTSPNRDVSNSTSSKVYLHRKHRYMKEYYATQESENSTEPIVDSENQCQTTSSTPNFFQYDLPRPDKYYATQESENSTEPIVDSENQCQTTSSTPNFFQYDLPRPDKYCATQESENSTEPIVDSENQCQTTSSIPNFFQYDLSRTECRDLLYRNPSPPRYCPRSPSSSPVTTVPAVMNVALPTSETPSTTIQGSAMSSHYSNRRNIKLKRLGRKPFRGSKKRISRFAKMEDMMRKILDVQKKILKYNKENSQMLKTALLMK